MSVVLTVNVNGMRAARRRGGLNWLAASGADVLLLQEVRCNKDQLAACLTGSALEGWHVAHAPAAVAGRAGVAVLSTSELLAVRIGLPGFAEEGRWVEADLMLDGQLCTVVSVYVHTGEAGTVRQSEKFAFLDAVSSRIAELAQRSVAGDGSAIIAGDLNIAHRQVDLKNWKGNRGKAGYLPAEQGYIDRWLAGGWTDLGREHGGEGPGPFTWWSWRGKAFDNDTGWRIDYVLCTADLAQRAVKVEVGRAATYAQRWSDHASVTAHFQPWSA